MSIETVIKLNKFTPRSYQLPIAKAIASEGGQYRKLLIVLPRRAGKDILMFNLQIRPAIREVGNYFYCLPTFAQARSVIWESITNTGERFLDFIPSELITKIRNDTMQITLVNGSQIKLIGSDSYDTSIIGTNPKMIVFSEYALADENAYKLAAMPILRANNGIVCLISCVAPDTLVLGDNGLQRIKNVSESREEYSNLNKKIYGIGGFHDAEQFYYGGKQETLIITLESGYELECTRVHKIWNGSEWIVSNDLKVGDLIPIQYGQNVWGNGLGKNSFSSNAIGNRIFRFDFDNLDDDFFYLLGLIHADGNYDRNKVTVTKKKDPEITQFLQDYGFRTRPDRMHHELNSREFCWFLECIGFKHGARNKSFPDKMFSCTREQMRSFIQGIFDGDGCSASGVTKRGYVKLTSTCKQFIKDLQVILLNFGICSAIRSEDKAPTTKVKVWSRIYNIEITGHFAHVFYRDIGFRLDRKQKNWSNVPASCADESGNVYPVAVEKLEGYSLPKWQVTNPERITRRLIRTLNKNKPHPYLQMLLDEKYFYSPIKEISFSQNEVFDFCISVTHSFLSNGFLSHNTPRGKNHMYELYEIAKNSPEWFTYFKTVEDTQHIRVEEIKKDIASGEISEDMARQEYWCSFELGQEGSLYAKYIQNMRLRGQIGIVPWEPYHKVHTAWDLGIADPTCIIFFQTIGELVRIIDYYEASDRSMDHFARIIAEKPYVYGYHFPPHDIMARESARGLTKREMYKELGIKFTDPVQIDIEDGIELVRRTFSKMWIDEKNCKQLIKALENYRYAWDDKLKRYKSSPLHDNNSHASDAMRYLCAALPKCRQGTGPEELEKRYQDAMYGNNSNMPPMFR